MHNQPVVSPHSGQRAVWLQASMSLGSPPPLWKADIHAPPVKLRALVCMTVEMAASEAQGAQDHACGRARPRGKVVGSSAHPSDDVLRFHWKGWQRQSRSNCENNTKACFRNRGCMYVRTSQFQAWRCDLHRSLSPDFLTHSRFPWPQQRCSFSALVKP